MRTTTMSLLILIAACEMPWAVELEEPMASVPEAYREWTADVAECMGHTPAFAVGRFERIRWYTSPSIVNRESGEEALGLWTEPHKIVIRSDHTRDERVVKHELIHDLLGSGAHRSAYFASCAT